LFENGICENGESSPNIFYLLLFVTRLSVVRGVFLEGTYLSFVITVWSVKF